MSLVYHTTKHGLVVASRGTDEAALQRALKQTDDRLILVRDLDPQTGRDVYKVMYWIADDRPAVWVCDWRDPDGTPRALSSGLLALVESQRKDRPGGYDAFAAADDANAALVAGRRKAADQAIDDVTDQHKARVERGRVTVSRATMRRPREWQRNTHRPGWAR